MHLFVTCARTHSHTHSGPSFNLRGSLLACLTYPHSCHLIHQRQQGIAVARAQMVAFALCGRQGRHHSDLDQQLPQLLEQRRPEENGYGVVVVRG